MANGITNNASSSAKTSQRSTQLNVQNSAPKNFNNHSGAFGGFSSFDINGVFKVLFGLLLLFSVFRVLNNNEPITLYAFFEKVVAAPTIPTDWLSVFDTSFGSTFPTGLKWLGSIVDFFSEAFSFALFTSTAALNVVVFFLYFLRWLLF